MDTIELQVKNQALHFAIDTHPKRHNIDEKPSPEEYVARAKVFEAYFKDGGSAF